MELSVMALIGVVVRLSCQISCISDGAVRFVHAGNWGIFHACNGVSFRRDLLHIDVLMQKQLG